MGAVDIQVMGRQHSDYQDALRQAGAKVISARFAGLSDAQFVEDTALCLPGLAVMMRPGAKPAGGSGTHA